MNSNGINEDGTYRLADFVRFSMRVVLNRSDTDSIAYKYVSHRPKEMIDKRKPSIMDYDLLSWIVHSTPLYPEPKSIYIHYRLGDVTSGSHGYITPQNIIDLIEKYNLKDTFSKVVIVYGFHKDSLKYVDVSDGIINELVGKLEDIGMSVTLKSTTPDEDFINCAKADCFIPTTRGFSFLAAAINRNRVIWDFQTPPRFEWLLNNAANIQSSLAGYEYQRSNGLNQ